MVSISQPADKQQIEDLWKISFGDSDDFIRLFFDRVYKDEQTLVIRQHDQVVSALQILPYEMAFCGATVSAGYICGVCTLPSERGKGLMSKLMQQAIEVMKQRDYAIAILIPATPQLFNLYRRFDFTDIFYYALEDIQAGKPATVHSHLISVKVDINMQTIDSDYFAKSATNMIPFATLYQFYHSKQLERRDSILHTVSQFEIICQDRKLGGGEIWVAIVNEQLAGLALTDPISTNVLSIREIVTDNAAIKHQLVQSILSHHQLQHARLRIPPAPSRSIPYGMARILNKNQMIDLYRSFHNPSPLPDFSKHDASSLTQQLLHCPNRYPYMNLMLD